jgi:hypothetical protein
VGRGIRVRPDQRPEGLGAVCHPVALGRAERAVREGSRVRVAGGVERGQRARVQAQADSGEAAGELPVFRAPTMADTTSGRLMTQLSATWAGVAPVSLATRLTASTAFQVRSEFS